MALGLVLYSFSPTIYAPVTSVLPTRLKSIGLGAVTMTGSTFGAERMLSELDRLPEMLEEMGRSCLRRTATIYS